MRSKVPNPFFILVQFIRRTKNTIPSPNCSFALQPEHPTPARPLASTTPFDLPHILQEFGWGVFILSLLRNKDLSLRLPRMTYSTFAFVCTPLNTNHDRIIETER
jgi:hypothetical protein